MDSTFTSYRYKGGKHERALRAQIDKFRCLGSETAEYLKVRFPALRRVRMQHIMYAYNGTALLACIGILVSNQPSASANASESVSAVQEVGAVAPVVTADDGYNYPHIRVERGEPRTRRLDYTASPYIREASVGSFARYLTISVPGQSVGDGNYIRSLDQMYARKREVYGENADVERLRQNTYVTYRTQRTYMTLGQYVRGVDQVLRENVEAIDWSALCHDKWVRLSGSKCQALRRIASGIDARALVSVQMTETFAKDTPGETNAWVLDQMYRYQGREAVDANPSLAGRIPVVGPFQITEQLVGPSDTRPHPITVVSNHSRLQVPLSIFDFKRNDHERGAHYGYIFDIAKLISELDDSEVACLERALGNRRDLVHLLASSHRGSGDTREFAKRWIYDGVTNPLNVFMYTVENRDYPRYAETAWKNYEGLDKYITETFPS